MESNQWCMDTEEDQFILLVSEELSVRRYLGSAALLMFVVNAIIIGVFSEVSSTRGLILVAGVFILTNVGILFLSVKEMISDWFDAANVIPKPAKNTEQQ